MTAVRHCGANNLDLLDKIRIRVVQSKNILVIHIQSHECQPSVLAMTLSIAMCHLIGEYMSNYQPQDRDYALLHISPKLWAYVGSI